MGFFDEERPSLFIPVAASCIIHVALLLSCILVQARMPEQPKETVIEVFPTAPAEVEALTAMRGGVRIADIDPPAVQKRPAKAKFVGLYDSSVEEETVGSGTGKGRGKGTGSGSAKGQGKTKSGRGGGKGSDAARRKDRLLSFDRDLFAMREPADEVTPSPSAPDAGKVSIGGSSGDFFPDIRRGEHTYLNVLRYPEISYFVRLKRAFRTTFNPAPVLREYFSMNRVAQGSIEVILAVAVNGSGQLAELFVLKESGVPGYDHEAMRTVRASSPFAKPPDKFLATDGVLRMMWTFTVYL